MGQRVLKSERFRDRWHAAPLSRIKGEWIVLWGEGEEGSVLKAEKEGLLSRRARNAW